MVFTVALEKMEWVSFFILLPIFLGILSNLVTDRVRIVYAKTPLGNPEKQAARLLVKLEQVEQRQESRVELYRFTISRTVLSIVLGML